ncbi:hypothetical protein DF185_06940 [Marinifilum breve]|uniref:PD-(D/E)XK nuclease family protein n=1 Tax=Marinifilum breve TaxID=2184082 RepID=A0A2V4A3B4_9BACT|nr:PD-(D/E)XK nuclease family protein [Marinifilum breve]PXY02377.1 hypothetical protein DF185_06940 [Marinifilum breve]
MIDKLNYMLQKLDLLKERFDVVREKEEKFNIFSVLHKEHDERRLHSRFIAALLDPFGSHELKDLFLQEFIRLFPQIKSGNFSDAQVYPEEWNKKENNNIDILVIDRKSRHAIIIENKIYAGDSNNSSGGQLERYFKHVRDAEGIPQENINVFYLTLDGHLPSGESLGEFECLENINGNCISYENEVIKWLDICIKEVSNKPFIRESILQYKKILNKMCNNETELEERKKIKDTIALSKETMDATKYLIDNFKHVKWHTIYEFWEELENNIENRGYEIIEQMDEEAITYIAHYSENKKYEDGGVRFRILPGLVAYVWHEKNEYLFWGFEKEEIDSSYSSKLTDLGKLGMIHERKIDWWNYFEFSDNDKLFLKDFSYQKTFDLIDAGLRSNTIEELLNGIEKFMREQLKLEIVKINASI